MSSAEQSLLAVFRKFQVGPGQMLCFNGPTLKQHRAALGELTAKGLLVKEGFSGAYSLTKSGFASMRDCH